MSKRGLPNDAADALRAGKRRFVCRINQGTFQMSGNTTLDDIADVIANIEATGWVLDHVSWPMDHRDHPSAFCIFRPGQPMMPPPAAAYQPQQQYPPQPYQSAPQGWPGQR